jgi:hypothetical protein
MTMSNPHKILNQTLLHSPPPELGKATNLYAATIETILLKGIPRIRGLNSHHAENDAGRVSLA